MIERRLALVDSVRCFKPRNRLLAALPHESLLTLQPHLKLTALPRGKVLCEADEPLRRVYFVESGAVSLVTVFENGSTAEMTTVGREGMIGIGALLGGDTALGRYVVPVSGRALAIEATGNMTVWKGVALVHRELLRMLRSEGVQRLEALGRPFDPQLHEAVSRRKGPAKAGTVVEELQAGYSLGSRLLRPARVIVAS